MRDDGTPNYIPYKLGRDRTNSFRMARSVNYPVGSAPVCSATLRQFHSQKKLIVLAAPRVCQYDTNYNYYEASPKINQWFARERLFYSNRCSLCAPWPVPTCVFPQQEDEAC